MHGNGGIGKDSYYIVQEAAYSDEIKGGISLFKNGEVPWSGCDSTIHNMFVFMEKWESAPGQEQ